MAFAIRLFLLLHFFVFAIHAQDISVYNLSEIPINIGLYSDNQPLTEIIKISPQEVTSISYSKQNSLTLICENQEEKIERNLNFLDGKDFYIVQDPDAMRILNKFEWQVVRPAKEKITSFYHKKIVKAVKNKIEGSKAAIKNNPYKKTVALVRNGNGLCEQEKAFLEKRMPRVQVALEKLLNCSLENKYVPRISFVSSGGGYRSMICTTGFLVGAQKNGLLDATTYLSTLSGSSWAVAVWLATGLSLESFREYIINAMERGLSTVSLQNAQEMMDAFIVKKIFRQPVTLVDLYGAIIGNALLHQFKHDKFCIYLSQQHEKIEQGQTVFPIYSAIYDQGNEHNHWYEFTPYEVGDLMTHYYVPTWAFGRKFEKGVSIDYAPEQSLAYQLGIFGSAFAGTVEKLYRHELEGSLGGGFVAQIAEKLFTETFAQKRLTCAKTHNFTTGIPGAPLQRKSIKLADAGLIMNLPFPPVSELRPERAVDIIIFLDSSTHKTDGRQLKKVAAFAKKHNLSFPNISDYIETEKNGITVLKDEKDLNKPVIIYLPNINSEMISKQCAEKKQLQEYLKYRENFDMDSCVKKGFAKTFNFKYKPDDANQLSMITEANMIASTDVILDEIKWVIDQKS